MWVHLKANTGVGLQEQWIKRAGNKPACSLRRGESIGTWEARLLNHDGISCVVMHTAATTLEIAQHYCETELRGMGWEVGVQHPEPF